jgi:hypothetical protein
MQQGNSNVWSVSVTGYRYPLWNKMGHMVPVDRLRRTINDSSELSKLGENQQALKLLDDEIAQAIRENRKVSICVLSRHAAVIADQMGDLLPRQAVSRAMPGARSPLRIW